MNEPLPTSNDVLSAADVAALLGYLTSRGKDQGKPRSKLIYTLTRDGKLPAPIDTNLPPRQWRWSRTRIDSYINGQVTA